MPTPTRFLTDILRQPAELQRTIAHLTGPGKSALGQAAALVRSAQHTFLTGIGASWSACFGAANLFLVAGRPVFTPEASELLHFAEIPARSVLVVLSRTGKSIEIVQLLEKARAHGAKVIGITNSAEGTLAKRADIPLVVPVPFDHAISVNTYSSLALAAGIFASASIGNLDSQLPPLSLAIQECEPLFATWCEQIDASGWLAPGAAYYFLARGGSLASAHEARLLWEEGVKAPATAMTTSGFRHGPQEIVPTGIHVCMWIDPARMRTQDLATARDLQTLGASVALVGHDLPKDAAQLVFQTPALPPHLQFVLDIIPIQLAAERLARLSGVDSDTFRVCSFVVEDEEGLLGKQSGRTQK